jgi:hypothetical protein
MRLVFVPAYPDTGLILGAENLLDARRSTSKGLDIRN